MYLCEFVVASEIYGTYKTDNFGEDSAKYPQCNLNSEF